MTIVGPFCLTRSNPTHQLTHPTHYKWKTFDPTQYNWQWSLQFSSDVFLDTELISYFLSLANIITLLLLLIGFRYLSDRP